jgi:hypothetical protein
VQISQDYICSKISVGPQDRSEYGEGWPNQLDTPHVDSGLIYFLNLRRGRRKLTAVQQLRREIPRLVAFADDWPGDNYSSKDYAYGAGPRSVCTVMRSPRPPTVNHQENRGSATPEPRVRAQFLHL